jgi:hypothetical protein
MEQPCQPLSCVGTTGILQLHLALQSGGARGSAGSLEWGGLTTERLSSACEHARVWAGVGAGPGATSGFSSPALASLLRTGELILAARTALGRVPGTEAPPALVEEARRQWLASRLTSLAFKARAEGVIW